MIGFGGRSAWTVRSGQLHQSNGTCPLLLWVVQCPDESATRLGRCRCVSWFKHPGWCDDNTGSAHVRVNLFVVVRERFPQPAALQLFRTDGCFGKRDHTCRGIYCLIEHIFLARFKRTVQMAVLQHRFIARGNIATSCWSWGAVNNRFVK